jgi:hypothetical protein
MSLSQVPSVFITIEGILHFEQKKPGGVYSWYVYIWGRLGFFKLGDEKLHAANGLLS